jgi:endonuclease/exonuclease/phosphatase family metal-dependent hydrolase
MRKLLLLITFSLTFPGLFSQNLEDLGFGTDNTLEVMSWNIEWFPKSGQTTIDYVIEIIQALDVDVLALQEINEKPMFEQLVNDLDGWDGYWVESEYLSLAYLYKPDVIDIIGISEIYANNNREFPRAPLVMKMKYSGEEFVIINNHLKCCGDGTLNLNNSWDEETRRYDACNLLEQYIRVFYPEGNVIFLGDLNDVLNDNTVNNVFQTFLDDTENYLFADIDIAEGSNANWSYPSWPSHLDHILITNELFDDLENEGSEIKTIKIDDYLDNGWWEYDNNVSDHRPVAIKLNMQSNGVHPGDAAKPSYSFSNYPNPFSGSTTLVFNPAPANSSVEIFNSTGQQIQYLSIPKGQTSVLWDAKDLPDGLYFVKLLVDQDLVSFIKLALVR